VDDRTREQYDGMGDPGHSVPLDPHLWHQRPRMPEEHRRMGLDPRTEEGALVEFASSLDAARPAHRVVAWVLLVSFAVPAVLILLRLFGELLSAVR
jgi:hypothetical protein